MQNAGSTPSSVSANVTVNRTTSGYSSVTWTPTLPQAASYAIYARWVAHPGHAALAQYTVTHAQGSSTVTGNQTADGGEWKLLGNFNLSPGAGHQVTLTNQVAGANLLTPPTVIADAVKFVLANGVDPDTVYYISTDHLNTPRLVADQNGVARWRWDNKEPFGANAPNENPSDAGAFVFNLRFPGQYFDKETNLHYNYFRDYDPAIGRYIQSDPIGLLGGLNTYAYVNSNPLSFTDPEGLQMSDVLANMPPPQSRVIDLSMTHRPKQPSAAAVSIRPENQNAFTCKNLCFIVIGTVGVGTHATADTIAGRVGAAAGVAVKTAAKGLAVLHVEDLIDCFRECDKKDAQCTPFTPLPEFLQR